MKQMKFFLVALMTVVMGMTVTSCLKGDDNPVRQARTIVKADYMGSSFTDAYGMKYTPVTPQALSGRIYMITYQFDSSLINANTKSIEITLLDAPSCLDGLNVLSSVQEPNCPIYGFSTQGDIPFFFDKTTLVIPFYYWVKNVNSGTEAEAEIAKHKFYLCYDRSAITEDATDLELTLTHVLDDENLTRQTFTGVYKAYDIASAINDFTSITGSKPTKVVLNAKTNAASNTLDGASNGRVTLEYKGE